MQRLGHRMFFEHALGAFGELVHLLCEFVHLAVDLTDHHLHRLATLQHIDKMLVRMIGQQSKTITNLERISGDVIADKVFEVTAQWDAVHLHQRFLCHHGFVLLGWMWFVGQLLNDRYLIAKG